MTDAATDTGATQTTETQTQQATSWVDGLPADLKDVVQKNGFTDPGSVVKAYAGASQLIGADKIPVPKDGVWDEAARAKLGIPAKPEEYKYEKPTLPDGVTWDENFEKAALPVLHQLGLTPKQVEGLIGFYAKQQTTQHGAMTQAQAEAAANAKAAVEKAAATLKGEWGQAYDERVAVAGRAVQHLGGEALVGVMNMELKDGTLVGDHPDILRAFAKIGGDLGESVLKTGQSTGAMTPAEAQAKADALMRSPEFTSQDQAVRERTIAEINKLFGMAHDNKQDVRGGVIVQAT